MLYIFTPSTDKKNATYVKWIFGYKMKTHLKHKNSSIEHFIHKFANKTRIHFPIFDTNSLVRICFKLKRKFSLN